MSHEKPEIIARKRHSRVMRWRIRRRLADPLAPRPSHGASFERFREGLSGAMPDAGGIVLAACTDFYYRQFAATLILSIEHQGAAQRFHLRRPSPETLIHVRRHAHVRLSWTPVLRIALLRRPFEHIGRLAKITRRDRDAIVVLVSGADPQAIGDLGKATNGLAAVCYGLFLGVPAVVLAGISLSKVGHFYDGLGRRRRQVDEDSFILDAMKDDPRLSTTEPDLAAKTGLKLWRPGGA